MRDFVFRRQLPILTAGTFVLSIFSAPCSGNKGGWPDIGRVHGEMVPETCIIEAKRLTAQGKNAEAVKLLCICVRDRPDVVALYYYRANALMKLKRYKEAVNDCGAQVRLEPALTRPLEMRAQCYLALNEKDKAMADLLKITRLQPDYTRANLMLSKLYRQKGNVFEAQRHLALSKRKAIGSVETTVSPAILTHTYHPGQDLMREATEKMAHGKPDLALESCKKLLAMSDFNLGAEHIGRFEVYELQGLVYQKMEDHAKAVASFDKVLQLQPKINRAYYLRAQSMFALGRFAECIADCDRASAGDKLLSKTTGELKSRAQARLARH